MSAIANRPIPLSVGAQFTPASFWSLLFCLSSGLTQNASRGSPRYDLRTETKRPKRRPRDSWTRRN